MHQSSASATPAHGTISRDENSPAFTQPHYSVDQIAEMWTMSRDTIRRLFATEQGVLKFVRPGNRYKRTYSTLRIPESVLNRVYRRIAIHR